MHSGVESTETETREHDDYLNQLDQRTPAGASAQDLTYDAAGNLRQEAVGGGAWRIAKRLDSDVYDTTHALNQERLMFYGADWQLLEEHVDDDLDQSPDRNVQYVWGPRYIDDVILHRQDNGADGGYDVTYYHLTDAQFSTVALFDAARSIPERISYDAYGQARYHRRADVNGDGAVTVNDLLIVLGNWGLWGRGDLDRSGAVDVVDQLEVLGFATALPQCPNRLHT